MDIKSKSERSENMAKIRARDTKPEMFIRSSLHKEGFRFKVSDSTVVGKPDLYFSKKRVAIFVHGCYWHRHQGCKFSYVPKSNVDFWIRKFDSNVKRDLNVREKLLSQNIRVLVVWECTVKKMIKSAELHEITLHKITFFLGDNSISYLEL